MSLQSRYPTHATPTRLVCAIAAVDRATSLGAPTKASDAATSVRALTRPSPGVTADLRLDRYELRCRPSTDTKHAAKGRGGGNESHPSQLSMMHQQLTDSVKGPLRPSALDPAYSGTKPVSLAHCMNVSASVAQFSHARRDTPTATRLPASAGASIGSPQNEHDTITRGSPLGCRNRESVRMRARRLFPTVITSPLPRSEKRQLHTDRAGWRPFPCVTRRKRIKSNRLRRLRGRQSRP